MTLDINCVAIVASVRKGKLAIILIIEGEWWIVCSSKPSPIVNVTVGISAARKSLNQTSAVRSTHQSLRRLDLHLLGVTIYYRLVGKGGAEKEEKTARL